MMSPRERVLAALRGLKPDRTPVANVAALAPLELQVRTGAFLPEAHLDPRLLVRLCAANHEVLGFDGVSFIINYFNEPAALGAGMAWGDRTTLPVVTSHPWSRAEDAILPRDLLEREPLRTNLEALRIARDTLGDEVAVIGKVMGPLSMVQMMLGVESAMLRLVDDPEGLRRLLEVSTDILVKSAAGQLDAGADAVLIGEGGAGAKMLSPAMYEDLLAGVHRRLLAEIPGPTILHMCGDITARLRSLETLGLVCFNFDWAIDPEAMRRISIGKFSIMGNINTLDLLRAGPDSIQKQVKACLRSGVDIISPGCAVSPECPVRNFEAMVSAVEEHALGGV